MDHEYLKSVLYALGGFILKYLWDETRTLKKEQVLQLTQAITFLTKEMNKNTVALAKNELQIEILNKRLEILPKMEKDIDALHSKFRGLNGNQEF